MVKVKQAIYCRKIIVIRAKKLTLLDKQYRKYLTIKESVEELPF